MVAEKVWELEGNVNQAMNVLLEPELGYNLQAKPSF